MANIRFSLQSLQTAVEKTSAEFQSSKIIARLWQKNYIIWRSEEVHKKSILNRLGWLRSVELMQTRVYELTAFGQEIKNAGFTHVVVLGMGGSSLCPDVCRATFGSAKGFPQLLVLDSTNPTSVKRIENGITLVSTLFIVASKSGGTTETNMFYKYFYDRVGTVKANAGENFIAVTDPNTQMERIAIEKKFRKIFLNPEDIGGRYSALSYFGLVPMALIGMDVKNVLASAANEMRACMNETLSENSTACIGIAMAEAFKAGKDKLTFVASHSIATFSYWAEQLIAESTGKEGKGIVPIEGEVFSSESPASMFSKDRMFVFLLLNNEKEKFSFLQAKLNELGLPFIEVQLENEYELGGEFFRWEFATAVAAVVMNINPFDEPNVKESKDNTVRVIEEFKTNGALPKKTPFASDAHIQLFGETKYVATVQSKAKNTSTTELLKTHCAGLPAHDYVAILAYIDQNESNARALYSLREKITTATGCVSTVGFGPRYLHSTGQLHKGGDRNGIFLLLTADEPTDVAIPSEPFSFEVLKNAQGLGDYLSIASRDYRLLHVHLGKDIEQGLKTLLAMY